MRKRTIWMLVALVILLLGVAGAYTVIGMHYQTHFFENVVINGFDVSDLTAAEAEKLIADKAEDYRIAVTTREGTQEVIEGSEIGYRFVSHGEVQEFLEQQNIFTWLPAFFGSGSSYTVDVSMEFDEALLNQAVSRMDCMDSAQVTSPRNAFVEKQADGTWTIVPEMEGNELDAKKVSDLIRERVEHGATGVNLEESGCYTEPSVRADDGALRAEAAVRNRYGSITVTYEMGGGVTEVLGPETITEWFSIDENMQPVFDREAVRAWVERFAQIYDTIGTWPAFVTSNGETVYPEARTYGWQMDQETETEELYNILMAGESVTRSPVWFESARTRMGKNGDIGDTYVEIDYTNQRMWYYKDGVLLVETPVVTGNVSAGNASPEGIFCIVGKEENAILKGEDYETPVSYWMPFYGGVGIHDADTWRTSYGGDIYQWGGSHGCINTPTTQAAVIFQNIDAGTPVVCYSSGINYGYSQIGTSSGGTQSSTPGVTDGDIVIIDGGGGTASAQEDWADESVYQPEAGQEEFPITIEDEWSDESLGDETVIY